MGQIKCKFDICQNIIALRCLLINSNSSLHTSQFTTTNLQFLNVNTLSNPECRTRLRQASKVVPPVHDWDTLCAYSGRAGNGVCLGDEGGALIIENQLVGVTLRWRYGCARGLPDGFTRISTYINWINSKTQLSF